MGQRLIDANALNVALRFAESHMIHGESEWLKGYVEGLRAAIAAVKDCPTIESEPMKCGRWVEDGYYDNPFVCSCCGGEGCYIADDGGKQYYPTKYCPNCGAKMDEEDSNG